MNTKHAYLGPGPAAKYDVMNALENSSISNLAVSRHVLTGRPGGAPFKKQPVYTLSKEKRFL